MIIKELCQGKQKCADGTWSTSTSKNACSWHGGLLKNIAESKNKTTVSRPTKAVEIVKPVEESESTNSGNGYSWAFADYTTRKGKQGEAIFLSFDQKPDRSTLNNLKNNAPGKWWYQKADQKWVTWSTPEQIKFLESGFEATFSNNAAPGTNKTYQSKRSGPKLSYRESKYPNMTKFKFEAEKYGIKVPARGEYYTKDEKYKAQKNLLLDRRLPDKQSFTLWNWGKAKIKAPEFKKTYKAKNGVKELHFKYIPPKILNPDFLTDEQALTYNAFAYTYNNLFPPILEIFKNDHQRLAKILNLFFRSYTGAYIFTDKKKDIAFISWFDAWNGIGQFNRDMLDKKFEWLSLSIEDNIEKAIEDLKAYDLMGSSRAIEQVLRFQVTPADIKDTNFTRLTNRINQVIQIFKILKDNLCIPSAKTYLRSSKEYKDYLKKRMDKYGAEKVEALYKGIPDITFTSDSLCSNDYFMDRRPLYSDYTNYFFNGVLKKDLNDKQFLILSKKGFKKVVEYMDSIKYTIPDNFLSWATNSMVNQFQNKVPQQIFGSGDWKSLTNRRTITPDFYEIVEEQRNKDYEAARLVLIEDAKIWLREVEKMKNKLRAYESKQPYLFSDKEYHTKGRYNALKNFISKVDEGIYLNHNYNVLSWAIYPKIRSSSNDKIDLSYRGTLRFGEGISYTEYDLTKFDRHLDHIKRNIEKNLPRLQTTDIRTLINKDQNYSINGLKEDLVRTVLSNLTEKVLKAVI